jgi:hypothetical protein
MRREWELFFGDFPEQFRKKLSGPQHVQELVESLDEMDVFPEADRDFVERRIDIKDILDDLFEEKIGLDIQVETVLQVGYRRVDEKQVVFVMDLLDHVLLPVSAIPAKSIYDIQRFRK